MRIHFGLLVVFATLLVPTASGADMPWGIHRLVMGSGGSTYCSPLPANCFDDVVIKPSLVTGSLRRLDEAINNHTTAAYFSGDDWKNIFPQFGNFPKQLAMLRGGLPLLRFERQEGSAVRYIATRQTRDQIMMQIRGPKRKPIRGVAFCLTVRRAR